MTTKKINHALYEIDRSGLDRTYLDKKFSVSEEEIKEAELRIGYKLPESYRYFLKTIGSGDFQATEFYGLVPNHIDLQEIPNALWFTNNMQEKLDLPKMLFAFESFDGDAVACLMLSRMKNRECPVIFWDHNESHVQQLKKPYVLAETFGDYFFKKIKELIEDTDKN